MFHRLFILSLSAFIVTIAFAQVTPVPSWCPLPLTTATLEPTPVNNLLPTELIPAGVYPCFSTDRTWFAYTQKTGDLPTSLWLARPNGTEEHELLSPNQLTAMRQENFEFTPFILSWQWLPGHPIIVFNVGAYPVDGLYVYDPDDLWTINADTGELLNLLPQGEGGEFQFTPDGKTIVVTYPDRLDFIAFDGSFHHQNVLPDYNVVGMGYLIYPQMLWSDKYQAFLVAVIPSEQRDWLENGQIRVWSVPVGTTPELIGEFFGSVFTFKMSPDGQFAAWEVWLDSESRQLYISSLDGSEQFMFLEHDLLRFSRWMPDSRHFLYDEELDGEGDSHPDFSGDICGSSEANENE